MYLWPFTAPHFGLYRAGRAAGDALGLPTRELAAAARQLGGHRRVSALITPDGAAIVCATSTTVRSPQNAAHEYKLRYVAFSARTGRPLYKAGPA